MARSVCHVATELDAGTRLDAFCAKHEAYRSRSEAARAIDENRVLVNGKSQPKKYLVNAGDAVVCELDDSSGDGVLQGEPIELDVRWEDDHLAVISKQPGLICHPANEHVSGTLVNALIYKYGAQNLCDVQGESDRLGIVHRLDGDTSGLMIVAKTNEAGEIIMDAMSRHEVDRRYLALVHGIISPDTGMVDIPIERNPSDRKTMRAGDGPFSREAITTFKVLERFAGDDVSDGYTLVECKLYTGRTHQIRVHMQYIGHPVVGDQTYNSHGPKNPRAQLGLSRQFLHSWHICFEHPITDEQIELSDGVPDDLASALQLIGKRSLGCTQAGMEVLND